MLEKLYSSIANNNKFFAPYLPKHLERHWSLFYNAFDGSVNAALYLQRIVAPGDDWSISRDTAAIYTEEREYTASVKGNPARAMLLCLVEMLHVAQDKTTADYERNRILQMLVQKRAVLRRENISYESNSILKNKMSTKITDNSSKIQLLTELINGINEGVKLIDEPLDGDGNES